jgi:O-antigen/teichoic acid export membrane protein
LEIIKLYVEIKEKEMAKIERTKNAGRNMIFELLKNIYGILMPFILRTAMIHYLGMEYTGLGGLFSSILGILNLAELGVGSAMVYSMYKPIAEDDEQKICALMRLYKIYYRIIGTFILGIGILITPFLSKLISGDYPSNINIYILYLMNLSVTVTSYWLYAYKNCLLNAHQKDYIASKIDLIINCVANVIQLISLIVFKNYYIYLAIELARQIVSNLIRAYVTSKIFPKYHAIGKLQKSEEKKINKSIKDLFTLKLSSTITQSSDTIIISAFLGLTLLARYQNYYYIFSAVSALVGIVFNSVRAGIGNSLIVETRQKNIKDFELFSFIIIWITVFCATGFICIYQPFITLWTGSDNLLPSGMPILFAILFMSRQYKYVLDTYKSAAGIWHKDRFRPLVAGLANLGLNLIMVQFWGIYGIIISTIISEVVIEIPWLIHNLFSLVFKTSTREYLIKLIKYLLVGVLTILLSTLIINQIKLELFYTIMIRALLVLILPNTLLTIIYLKKEKFKQMIDIVKRLLAK